MKFPQFNRIAFITGSTVALVIFAATMPVFGQNSPSVTTPVVIYDDLDISGQGAASTELGNLWVYGPAPYGVLANGGIRIDGSLTAGASGVTHVISGTANISADLAVSGNLQTTGRTSSRDLRFNGRLFINNTEVNPQTYFSGVSGAPIINQYQSAPNTVSGRRWVSASASCRNAGEILFICDMRHTPESSGLDDANWLKRITNIGGSDSCEVWAKQTAPRSAFSIIASATCIQP